MDDVLSHLNSGNADLTETLRLLEEADAMPTITMKPLVGARGYYSPRTNTIELSSPKGLPHEATHALDIQMKKKAKGHGNPNLDALLLSPEEKQFKEAYQKLNPATSNLPMNRSDKYRTNPLELRAYGVGNTVNGDSEYPVAPHVDATMATEMAILRDLYARTLRKKK